MRKTNLLFKIIAFALLQTFLMLDIAWSAGNELFLAAYAEDTGTLSPQLTINADAFINKYDDFSRNIPNIPDIFLPEKEGDTADFKQSFSRIVESFLDAEDEINEKLTGKDSVRTATKKISKMIKERITYKKQNEVDPYFITGVMCLLSGLGGGGKTTVALEMIELLKKELPHCYMHPRLQFDYYIRPTNERITYYGISAKQNFRPEVLGRLIEEGILKEDASDKDYVFWLKNNVTEQELIELGLSPDSCKSVLGVWENVPAKIKREGRKTEVVIEKFEVDRYVQDAWHLIRGETVLQPVFDDSTRGRLKIGRVNEDKLIVYNGEKSFLGFKNYGSAWSAVLIGEGEEEFLEKKLGKVQLKARGIQLNSGVLGLESLEIVGPNAQEVAVLGLGDNNNFICTEYIVENKKNRIGVDMPYFLSNEQVKEKKSKQGFSEHAQIFSLKIKDGRPVLEYDGRLQDSLTVRTLDISCREKDGYFIIYVNKIPHIIAKDRWKNLSFIVDLQWFAIPDNGMTIDLLQRIIPGSGVLLFEGVGVLCDEALAQEAITAQAECDNEIRFERMAIKRLKTEVRKEGILDNIQRRGLMMYTEERPFVHPWSRRAKISINSMSWEEVLWTFYRDGLLGRKNVREVLERLGMPNADSLLAALDEDSRMVIRKKLDSKDWYPEGYTLSPQRTPRYIPKESMMRIWVALQEAMRYYDNTKQLDNRDILLFLGDLLSPRLDVPADEFYPVRRFDYGVVGEAAVDEDYFQRYYLPFFEYILKERMGKIFVRRTILDDLSKNAPVPEGGDRQVTRLTVKNNVARSLYHDIRRKQEVGNKEDAELDIMQYLQLQADLLGENKGERFKLLDLKPHFSSNAFRQLLDENAEKVLRLNKVTGLTANPLWYSRANYAWEEVTKVRISVLEFFVNPILFDVLQKAGIIYSEPEYAEEYVCFDNGINTQAQLEARLEQITDEAWREEWKDIVIAIWQRYPKLNWPEIKEFYEDNLKDFIPQEEFGFNGWVVKSKSRKNPETLFEDKTKAPKKLIMDFIKANIVQECVAKDDFKDEGLVAKLIECGIIADDDRDPVRYCSFNADIKNKKQLMKTLAENKITENVDLIVNIWLGSNYLNLILDVWQKNAGLEWPELKARFEKSLKDWLPQAKINFLIHILEKYCRKNTADFVRLINAFDFNVMDRNIEFMNEKVEEGRIRLMYEYFLKEKKIRSWDKQKSFLMWIKLFQFVVKQTHEEDLGHILQGLYEDAENNPRIVLENTWSGQLQDILKGRFRLDSNNEDEKVLLLKGIMKYDQKNKDHAYFREGIKDAEELSELLNGISLKDKGQIIKIWQQVVKTKSLDIKFQWLKHHLSKYESRRAGSLSQMVPECLERGGLLGKESAAGNLVEYAI